MAYVSFKTLENGVFANLPMALEMSPAQRRAWHAELQSRLYRDGFCVKGTVATVDLTNGPVSALCEGYKPTRKDVSLLLQRVEKGVVKTAKKLVVKAPSSSSAEAAQARDAFMAELGFKWVAGKTMGYVKSL